MPPRRPTLRAVAFVWTLIVFAGCDSDDRRPPATPTIAGPTWLVERGVAQRALIAPSSAVHDFHFADRTSASGITFVDHIVDDAGKDYKAVHSATIAFRRSRGMSGWWI